MSYNGSLSDPFPIQNGVKQGCVLAPTLFNIFVASVFSIAVRNTTEGCSIVYRFDRQLFNLQCLQARTKVSKALLRDLQYADDCGAVARAVAKGGIGGVFHPPNFFETEIFGKSNYSFGKLRQHRLSEISVSEQQKNSC